MSKQKAWTIVALWLLASSIAFVITFWVDWFFAGFMFGGMIAFLLTMEVPRR